MTTGTSTITTEGHFGTTVVRFDDGASHWAGVLVGERTAIAGKNMWYELVPMMKPISKHTITDICALMESEAGSWTGTDDEEYAAHVAHVLVHPKRQLTSRERLEMSQCGWVRTKRRPFKGVTSDVWQKKLGNGSVAQALAVRHVLDLHQWKVAILCIAPDETITILADED